MSVPAEFLCSVCKEVVSLAVMMPCCAGATCQACAKNNINIYGSCPLCLAHSNTEDLIPYRMLRDKITKHLQSESPPTVLLPRAGRSPSREAIPDIEQDPGTEGVRLNPEDDTLGMFEAAMREIDAKKKSGVKADGSSVKKGQDALGGNLPSSKQRRNTQQKDLEDISSDDFDFDFDFEDLEKKPSKKNYARHFEPCQIATFNGNKALNNEGVREEDKSQVTANNEQAEIKPKKMDDEKGQVKNALKHALMNMDDYDPVRIRRMRKILESSQSSRKSKRKKDKKKKRKHELKIKEKTLKKLLKKDCIKEEVLEKLLKKKKKKKKDKKVRKSDSSSCSEDLPEKLGEPPETFPHIQVTLTNAGRRVEQDPEVSWSFNNNVASPSLKPGKI